MGYADLQTTGPHSVHLRGHRLSQVSPRRLPDPSSGLDPLPSRLRMMFEDRPLSPPPNTYDFSSCFFLNFKTSEKREILAGNNLLFWFLRPQNRGGGSSYPNPVQKYQTP